MRLAATFIVFAFALYLIALGIVALVDRERAARFLGSFAQTRRANTSEGLLRLTVGAAFVGLADDLPVSGVFRAFGLVLIVSALAILAFPDLHKRFANRVVPGATRMVLAIGLVALGSGIGLAWIAWPLIATPHAPY